jgi:DNA-binding protein HU-beta
MPVTKTDVEAYVADETNLTRAQAKKAVDAVFGCITKSLAKGGEVRVTGFGSFKVTATKARTGRNPRTNEPMKIPAGKRPTFKAGTGLKEAVSSAKKKK